MSKSRGSGLWWGNFRGLGGFALHPESANLGRLMRKGQLLLERLERSCRNEALCRRWKSLKCVLIGSTEILALLVARDR